jgi:hypothetical protein
MSAVYSKTAGDLIREGLRDSSITSSLIAVTAEDFADGLSKFNDILVNLQNLGINLWREQDAVMPLNPNQTVYDLGTSGAHCFSDYELKSTTAAAIAGATTINLAVSGITAGDYIGIKMDDGNRHWSTVSTIGASSVVIAGTGLTYASASGSEVYTYTTKIDRPLRVSSLRYLSTNTADESEVESCSRETYLKTPNKTSVAQVSQWYYSPLLGSGKLYLWGVASSCSELVKFSYLKPQYVIESQVESILVPVEWYPALKWQLASDLAVARGVAAERIVAIEAKAQKYMTDARDFDEEQEAMGIAPYNG